MAGLLHPGLMISKAAIHLQTSYMNKQHLSVDGSVGHQARLPGIVTNVGIGSGSERFGDDVKPMHGAGDSGREGFGLLRQRAAESARNLTITFKANSYDVLAIGVGIGSILGYLAALRWVCDRF